MVEENAKFKLKVVKIWSNKKILLVSRDKISEDHDIKSRLCVFSNVTMGACVRHFQNIKKVNENNQNGLDACVLTRGFGFRFWVH